MTTITARCIIKSIALIALVKVSDSPPTIAAMMAKNIVKKMICRTSPVANASAGFLGIIFTRVSMMIIAELLSPTPCLLTYPALL